MEIEDLKTIWKKQSEGFQHKEKAELATMLRGRSTSIISRLKRNVWLELIFTFTGAVALVAYASTLPAGALKWTSITIPVFFCIYSLYYVKKLRLLHRFDPGGENLRASLENLVRDLRGYLKFYRRSYAILYPVYLFLALLFSAIERGADGFARLLTKADVMIPLVLGVGLFFVGSTWLTSWYLQKLYGKHLQKLEAMLREIGDR
jgi:hypothetical protein